MPENTEEIETDATAENVTDENLSTDADDDATPEGADALGDAGKKALDSMKSKWRAERDKRRELEEKLANGAAPASTEKVSPDADEIRREAAREATVKANARILRSEIKAAAAGKFVDISDVIPNLDMDAFEIDENGDVDADEIADAIQDLLTRKPHLAAATAKRFQGTGDNGAARKATGPAQLTRDDLDKLSPAEIVKAKAEGRLANLFSGK